jgi:hypothetical protein
MELRQMESLAPLEQMASQLLWVLQRILGISIVLGILQLAILHYICAEPVQLRLQRRLLLPDLQSQTRAPLLPQILPILLLLN